MPTRGGWLVVAGGLALVVTGRILGPVEFYIVGCVAIAAVAIASALRWARPSRLAIARRVSPARIPAGEAARIDLDLANRSRHRSPVLRLTDAISGTRGVRLTIAPIGPLGTTHGAYRLPTTRRGVLEIGPIHIDDIDPLGLAQRRHVVASDARLIVHPPIEVLPALRVPVGDEMFTGEDLRQSLGLSIEEFDGLRDYAAGDDPRHIHWPSSARHDELLVRQFRPPRHGRITVVIDTRPPGDDDGALDRTTSVAASIAAAVLTAGDAVRLQTTDGRSTPFVAGESQLDAVLEFLALLAGGAAEIHRDVPTAAGLVVAVSSDSRLHDDEHRIPLVQRLRAGLLITCDTQRWSEEAVPGGRSGDWIHLTGPGQLAAHWQLRAGAVALRR